MVERNILRRLYIKIIAATMAAISLCVAASWITHQWSNLWFAVLALIGFGYTFYSVYNAQRKGQIVSIQALCIGTMDTGSVLSKAQKMRTYRFLAKSNEDDADSLYIKAERGKYREGETYCLLFREVPSGEYNEKNLLTYGIIPPSFGTETVQPDNLPSNAIRFSDIAKKEEGE